MRLTDADIEELYRTQYRALAGTARLLLGDAHGAEEAVQEAFVRVYRVRARIRSDGAVGYLRTTVVNECRNRLRHRSVRRRRTQPRAVVEPGPEETVGLTEEQRSVAALVAALSPRQRECVVLRFWLDASEREIADALGISVGSVKTHMHRAMEFLTAALMAESEP